MRTKMICLAFLLMLLPACARQATDITGVEKPNNGAPIKPGAEIAAVYTGDWTNHVLSEARYALNRSRSGRSNLTYQGQFMGDWNYVTGGSDNRAYEAKRREYSGSTGPVGFRTYELGGWCKFWADLVLYRSSYGLGNGWHLCLPSGYTYATADVRTAGPGWVLQSTLPHTAIVDAPYYAANGSRIGWWVIDSNWIGSTGGQYSYWVGRHAMTFAVLQAYGFRAWKPNYMRAYVN